MSGVGGQGEGVDTWTGEKEQEEAGWGLLDKPAELGGAQLAHVRRMHGWNTFCF